MFDGEINSDKVVVIEIKLQKEEGNKRIIFRLVGIGSEEHYADIENGNKNKICVQYDFGIATFTMDYSTQFLFEENHMTGDNWIWKRF